MKSRIVLLALAILIGASSPAFAGSAESISFTTFKQLLQRGDIHDSQLLVKFKTNQAAQSWQSVLSGLSVQKVTALYQPNKYLQPWKDAITKWQLVTFRTNTNLAQTFVQLLANPEVEYVVPNYRFTQNALPNDLDSDLWGLKNTGQTGGTASADIDAEHGWDYATDASSVIVAVIDTGIDYTHPELANNIWTNPGEIAGNGIDDDGNGYIDDVHGYDFADNDGDPIDVVAQGHGTHVSGTIAAEGNNGSGITGVAWKAKLMAVKIFSDTSPYAYTDDIFNGIIYAADMGAKVSNNSWGAFFSDSSAAHAIDKPIIEAIKYANDAGMLFVVAAGNNSNNTDESANLAFPAGLDLPNVLTVAATDHNDELANFSDRGITGADLAAPGVSILSTLPNNNYDHYNGTSMATPHVTGAAALLYSQIPDLSPGEARAIIVNTAEQVSALQGQVLSNGRLNLAQLLAFAGETTQGSCNSFTTTPINHYSAGRAAYCSGSYINMCAVGSGEPIGTSYSSTPVTLYEISAGYYSKIEDCGEPVAIDYPPVLINTDAGEINLLVGSSYNLPNVVATDREDGDLSASIVVQGSVDTGVPGEYHVRFQVVDSAGNAAVPVIQVVNVYGEDTAPEIGLYGNYCAIPLFCSFDAAQLGTNWVDPGYVAWDLIDGDLTNQVNSTAGALDINKEGLQTVHYSVTDSAGNDWWGSDSLFRVIVFLDENIPYINLESPFQFAGFGSDQSVVNTYVRQSPETFYPRYSVFDLKDEEIWSTGVIEESHNVDLNQAGTYQVTITLTDSENYSTTAIQTINVINDVTPPVATLNGDPVIDVEIGSAWYNDPYVTVVDDLDHNAYAERDLDIDLNVEGDYVATYTPSDASGNVGTAVNRTFRVIRSHWNHVPRMASVNAPTSVGSVTLTGTAFDIDGDIVRVEAQFNQDGNWVDLGTLTNESAFLVGFSYTYNIIGQHYVQFRAIDANGNVSELWGASFRVKLSNSPPVLSNIQMAIDGLTVTFTGNTSDPDNNAVAMYYVGDLQLECTGLASWTCTGTATEPGDYYSKFRAYDSDGNYSGFYHYDYSLSEPVNVCVTAKNTIHISEGRALECGTLWSKKACAVGSGDDLGSSSTWFPATTSVMETSPGYWEKVSACP